MTGAGQTTGTNSNTEERWRSCLDGIRMRQAEALAKLYDECSPILYGLALRILQDPADAEEVILDVFQQVWNRPHRYDPNRGRVWTWLATMTRSRAIDRLRQCAGRRAREAPMVADEQEWAEPGEEAEERLILRQERKLVRDAMNALPRDQRQALELAFFAGLTHVEVADRLGAPLGTIKTRIRAGLRQLRAAIPPGGVLSQRPDA